MGVYGHRWIWTCQLFAGGSPDKHKSNWLFPFGTTFHCFVVSWFCFFLLILYSVWISKQTEGLNVWWTYIIVFSWHYAIESLKAMHTAALICLWPYYFCGADKLLPQCLCITKGKLFWLSLPDRALYCSFFVYLFWFGFSPTAYALQVGASASNGTFQRNVFGGT